MLFRGQAGMAPDWGKGRVRSPNGQQCRVIGLGGHVVPGD